MLAATGVGAGDLAVAGLAGSDIGVAMLWPVVIGAFFKFVLTEGLVRWQLVTDQTFLEGLVHRLGRWVGALFLVYLVFWSFFVGSALMGACGVAFHALVPWFDRAEDGKAYWGLIHSLVGVALVLRGGFALFERVMRLCIGLMFAVVIVTALLFWPGTEAVLRGLFVPQPESIQGEGLARSVALLGGVGGTVTILCYGYWIREKGRSGPEALIGCRWDLAAGYLVTALFGLAMVIIGHRVTVEGGGAALIVRIGEQLGESLGAVGKMAFLVGAWGAVFSSLLGVWQAVPFLFADVWGRLVGDATSHEPVRSPSVSRPYRWFLVALALGPVPGLWMTFRAVQNLYAVVGAGFLPFVAIALLVLNGRRQWVGAARNRPLTVLTLLGILGFFLVVLARKAGLLG